MISTSSSLVPLLSLLCLWIPLQPQHLHDMKLFPSCHFTFGFPPTVLLLSSLDKTLSVSLIHFVLCVPVWQPFLLKHVLFHRSSLVSPLSYFLLQVFVGSLTPILDWTVCGYTGSLTIPPIQLDNWWKTRTALPSQLQLHVFIPTLAEETRVWPWGSFRCSEVNCPCKKVNNFLLF